MKAEDLLIPDLPMVILVGVLIVVLIVNIIYMLTEPACPVPTTVYPSPVPEEEEGTPQNGLVGRDEPCYYCYPECTCHEPPLADEIVEMDRPCGDNGPHFEDLIHKLDEVLEVGQVYETVATRDSKKCGSDEVYWMAWLRSYADAKCCGYDELVAFEKKPPKRFVYALNGEIIEVYGNGYGSTA